MSDKWIESLEAHFGMSKEKKEEPKVSPPRKESIPSPPKEKVKKGETFSTNPEDVDDASLPEEVRKIRKLLRHYQNKAKKIKSSIPAKKPGNTPGT
jgi:hypothetical protein